MGRIPDGDGCVVCGTADNRLVDRYGRIITYLRIAVTDRCNLRCGYCMPEEGVRVLSGDQLLGLDEIYTLVALISAMGVDKVRLTGGEPLLRPGLADLIRNLKTIPDLKNLHITSNGVETWKHIPELRDAGLNGINYSLDTLDRERFIKFTRRDYLADVLKSIRDSVDAGIPVKINCVIQSGKNFDEIGVLSALAEALPLQVRFIEQMSFNGQSGRAVLPATKDMIRSRLEELYPGMEPIIAKTGTVDAFRIPGYSGTVGIISGHSRTFCGQCDRLRITPEGMLKNCLYDDGVLNLRDLLRNGNDPEIVRDAVRAALMQKHGNGFEAEEELTEYRSMAAIGG